MTTAPSAAETPDWLEEPEESFYESRLSGRAQSKLARAADAWVGYRESRASRTMGPSSRAWREFLSYYNGLYQSQAPDPYEFGRLLVRNGVPTWPNPYAEGANEHFDFHPEGLILADLEAVLADLSESWAQQQGDAEEEHTPAEGGLSLEWPPMQEVLRLQELDRLRCQRQWRKIAGVCWIQSVLKLKDLQWLRARVHEDNLTWATIHALKTAPLKAYGLSGTKALAAALRLGLLTQKIADDLKEKMDESGEFKHA